MAKYSIGIDFGTLSGRALLVNLSDGNEIASEIFEYPHGIFGGNESTSSSYALQHPQDYIDVLSRTIPVILRKSGVSADDIVGLGIDFTACTVLPVLRDGTPLCFLEKYKHEPHAYVKLWKHHSAQRYADRLNEIAEQTNQPWLSLYGGKTSYQWEIPKLMEILNDNEGIYNEMYRFVEAADWIVWQLTGKESRSGSVAGHKGLWSKKNGYPNKEFFKLLDSRLENVIGTKICDCVQTVGEAAGKICESASELTGLNIGTAVAVGNIDAHVSLPAAGIVDSEKMLMIMGTSACHILMSDEEKSIPGICGVVEDGVIEGVFGYEAGQACMGDHFDWFTKQCGLTHEELTNRAKELKPGESGLLALDWWNGNRSVLNDADLTGMILGLTLHTTPEEIYRALIEATAYGTKMIIDTYEQNGLPIKELYAAGGIARKNSLVMQIYADVTGRTIKISGSDEAAALGSAMFGAVASGYFKDIRDAAKVMAKVKDEIYTPIYENTVVYNKLYSEYKALHDYFGKGENNVMKRLMAIKNEKIQ